MAPLLGDISTSPLRRIATPGAGAIHSINCGQWLAFDAVCPERAATAGLVLPFADARAMNLHLAGIARNVAPGAHALLVLGGAGWHRAASSSRPTTSRSFS
jgi:hypothetical protein